MKKFIVLCGIDGAGKTTISEMLKSHLPEWHFTREPYSSCYKECIKITHDPMEKAYLFCADRVFHLRHELNQVIYSKNVVCDRFHYCNIAYQATEYNNLYGKDITEFLKKIQPDLPTITHTIWFKCDPAVAYRRKKEFSVKFLQDVQDKYDAILPVDRYVIDTTNDIPHETFKKVLNIII